jgi:hypothetical protein
MLERYSLLSLDILGLTGGFVQFTEARIELQRPLTERKQSLNDRAEPLIDHVEPLIWLLTASCELITENCVTKHEAQSTGLHLSARRTSHPAHPV